MERKIDTKNVYVTYKEISNNIIKDDFLYILTMEICYYMHHFIDRCELFNIDLSLILSYCVNSITFDISHEVREYLHKCNRNDIHIDPAIRFQSMRNPAGYAASSQKNKTAYLNFLRLVIAFQYYWIDQEPCYFETLLDQTLVSYDSSSNSIYLPFKQPIIIFFTTKEVNMKNPTIEDNNIQKPNFWKRLFHKEKPDTKFRLVVKNYPVTINIKF